MSVSTATLVAPAPNGATPPPTAPMTAKPARVEMPLTNAAQIAPETGDPWYKVIAAKIAKAAKQVVALAVRFFNWAKEGIVTLFSNMPGLATVAGAVLLATKKGYHLAVTAVEKGVGLIGKALGFLGKAIGWVLSKVSDGIKWVLGKINPKAAEWYEGAVFSAKVVFAKVVDGIKRAFANGIAALRTGVARVMVGIASVFTGGLLLLNNLLGGSIATLGWTQMSGFGAVFSMASPLGVLVTVGSLVAGFFLGGIISGLINGQEDVQLSLELQADAA